MHGAARMVVASQEMLRSRPSNVPAFIKFVNSTGRQVDVFWLDYSGIPQRYACLQPDKSLAMKTYEGHPFRFVDRDTNETMHVAHQPIFWPQPWNRCPELDRAGRLMRCEVHIHLPMRSLREMAIWQLVLQCRTAERLGQLELPHTLAAELRLVLQVYERRAGAEVGAQ